MRFRFDLQLAARDPARTILTGTTGLRVELRFLVPYPLSAAIEGVFQHGRLARGFAPPPAGVGRRRGTCRQTSHRCSLRAGVEPRREESDPLLAALLGVHPLEWLRAALNEIGSLRWKRMARQSGCRRASPGGVSWSAGGCWACAARPCCGRPWQAPLALEQLRRLRPAWIAEDDPRTKSLMRQRLACELRPVPANFDHQPRLASGWRPPWARRLLLPWNGAAIAAATEARKPRPSLT